MAKTGSAMPSANAPVKQHEAFLEETKTLLHPGNFQVCGRSIEMYSLGKYLGKVLVFFGLFFQPFYNHLGCDHETTFEPTVRTNRCSSCLTLLNASRQARSFLLVSPSVVCQGKLTPLILHFHRKATLCKELLQTVSKVDSGFSQFRFEKFPTDP